MIVVDKLTKRFGDRDVVRDVSFTVERGEILGFLGPNGAGKTTTMRMLTCYFPPTSGRAQVAGFDIVDNSLQVRKHVGYMPENVPLYNDLPVEAYLGFVADVKGVSARERRKHVDAIIDETSLGEVRDFPIGKISRGFRQRVGLAQAIVGNPDVLILDEPTVGLDPRQIVEIRALIRNLASRSTVILSTHIMQEVESLCGRVIIIDCGKIREVDTVDNIRTRMAEGGLVEIVVQGATLPAITDALTKIDGVKQVVEVATEDDARRCQVMTSGSRALLGDIAATIVKSGWSLHELQQKADSLESIFIRVVSKQETDPVDEAPSATAASEKKEAR